MTGPVEITQEVVRHHLDYDAETGIFRWRNVRPPAKPGDIVGSPAHGYLRIVLQRRFLMAHRVAWLYVHGRWPTALIDHINGDRADNRIANLREATHAENHQNVRISAANKTGYPGVSWSNHRQKFVASIRLQYKQFTIGRFDTAEEAGAAYAKAKAELHTFAPKVLA